MRVSKEVFRIGDQYSFSDANRLYAAHELWKPEISKNKDTKWLVKKTNQNRVQRGLTSAGKKSRGLRSKNPMNKSRPSVRAGMRRGK